MALDKSNINRCISLCLLVLVSIFGLLLLLHLATLIFGPSKSACTKQVCLTRFLEGPPAFNNEALANYLKGNYYTPPASSDYHLSGHTGSTTSFEALLEFVKEYFKNKRGGVFVELGAGDGEYRSLTLPLERTLGWSGLLVEPHPEMHRRLLKKGRKAQLAKICISPYSYPAKLRLSHPRLIDAVEEPAKVEQLGTTKLEMLWPKAGEKERDSVEVQCIPLENVIYAGDLTSHIDLLVLDMSGSDLDILLNTKLDQLPEMEMIVVHSNGADISSDVSGYFLERNMIIKKVFGDKTGDASYVLIKFDASKDL